MNKVILKGRTTKLPLVRYTDDKEPLCCARLTLAVEDRSWKEADDKFHVDYIPCFSIGKLAELIEKSVGKGQELVLCGKWRSSSYKKDGETIYTQTLFVQELYFCGKKADSPVPYDDSFMDIPDYADGELPFN